VIQVQQHLQRLLNDGMGLPPFDVHHEADAAGLVLEPRIIKPLFARGGPARAIATALRLCSIRHVQEIYISRLTATKVG
jgi:hypothetical protein